MSSADVLRKYISNNIDGKNSGVDVVRNNISNSDVGGNSVDVLRIIDNRLDRLYDVAVKQWLAYEELIYDKLKHPEKYKVFNKNTPKPITMKLIRTLGLVREQKIERWLRDSFPEYQGYVVKHWNKEDEPDFIVYKNDKPFMVVEVKNYGEKSFMLESEFQKIITRLTKYDCFKLLIVSTGYNLIRKTSTKLTNNKTYTYYNTNIRKTSEELRSKGIYTWILGEQDLMSMKQFDEIVEYAKKIKNKEQLEGWINE
jgi:hypothetical protein